MVDIRHDRRGAGEPVVLIHGIGHHRRAWEPLASLLAERYEVIAVDLPGHGESPAPARPHTYSIPSHADQFEQLFADLGLDRPHVIGNSLGGLMALHLAERGAVRSCLALSPAGFMTTAGALWAGAALFGLRGMTLAPRRVISLAGATPTSRRLFMGSLYVNADRLARDDFVADSLNLRRSRGFWSHIARFTAMRPPRSLGAPTTIAWGARDRLLRPGQARRAQRRLSAARFVPLPHCGHVPMLDDPELILQVATQTFAAAAPEVAPRVVGDVA